MIQMMIEEKKYNVKKYIKNEEKKNTHTHTNDQ